MENKTLILPDDWGRSAYHDFLATEGVPVHRGLAVPSLRDIEVAPWDRLDAKGAYVQLDGTEDTNNAYILELAPGRSSAPERHLFEEVFFVVSGRGTCEVKSPTGERQTFEWQEGSLFAIPMNAEHRLHNGSGIESARLLAVTTAPLVINLFHTPEFVYGSSYDFLDRFSGEREYFSAEGTLYSIPNNTRRILETNFVADVYRMQLFDWAERGAGGKNVKFELANNTMVAHVSEFPIGSYKKMHRHGPGAHVIILAGQGFSLLRPDHESEFEDVQWGPGAMFVPPGNWWHQHFNTGSTPARYLAIRWGSSKWKLTRYLDHQGIDKSTKEGGNQIDYTDQDPQVHRLFLERCAANGTKVNMDGLGIPV